MSDTYLDMLPKHKQSQEEMDKKAFTKAISDEAERIVNQLPAVLDEIIDEGAAVLFNQMPSCLATEDPVTHDVMTAKHIRRMLAGKVANKLGKGMSFLQK